MKKRSTAQIWAAVAASAAPAINKIPRKHIPNDLGIAYGGILYLGAYCGLLRPSQARDPAIIKIAVTTYFEQTAKLPPVEVLIANAHRKIRAFSISPLNQSTTT